MPTPVLTPAGFAPGQAMYVTGPTGQADPVSANNPMPSQPSYGAAASTAVSGAASTSGNSNPFTPDLGRAIWVRLSGSWTGTAQLTRSTDGGATWYPITTGSGTVKGLWTGNVNAPITEETCKGAIYRLEIALTSGTINYEVRQ